MDSVQPAAGAADLLRTQLQRAFHAAFVDVDGLDDGECFWEPVVSCWSVRRRGEAEPGWGTGEWVCEDVWPPPEPLPVTTIAWRLVHLCAWTDVYRSYAFEDGSLGLPGFDVPGTAAGALDWFARSQRAFTAAVASLRDEDLDELRPAHWGGLLPIEFLVSTIAVEHVHHGAEITLLRDLRRGVARPLTS